MKTGSHRLTVGEIPYLNSVPFYWDKSGGEDFRWAAIPPREMGRLAREGAVDAGPLSLMDAFSVERDFEPLSDFGIAVSGPVQSVLLFSEAPLRELAGRPVGITPDTATSSELLKLILERKYGAAASYRAGFAESDAARLLIGDEALKGLCDPGLKARFPVIADLGEEWHRWQGLPFVFARWMVRRSAAPEAKLKLAGMLDRNLRSPERYGAASARWFEEKKDWKYPEVLGYVAAFRYRFGEQELRAIAAFRGLVSSAAAA